LLTRFISSLVLLLASTSLFAAIDLTTVTGWSTVLQGADLDHGNDQQATASIDLLGNATYPMFYMEFDDQGDADPLNDEVAFSFRADKVVDNQGDFKGYLWIGLDFDNDGKIDSFMVLNGDGTPSGQTLTVYDSDSSKANNSPSSTSLLATTAVSVTAGFSFYHAVANDIADIDTDSDNDYIVSYKIYLNGTGGLAAALNTTKLSTTGLALSTLNSGAGVDSNTPFKIVVSSAQQVNSLNGDLGGYDAADSDGAVLYTVKGAFTPTITYSDADPLDATQTTITAAPTTIAADGLTTSTITVQAKDSVGTNLTVSAGTLVLSTTGSASLSSVTDNTDGTYTAAVTNTVAETVTISGTIAGTAITDTADVTFIPGTASGVTTTITISPTSVAADGVSTATITVQAKDINGNNLIISGGAVILSVTGDASISSVTDNNNGTYTATVSNTTIETVTVSGSIAGITITDTDDVIFTDATKPVISLTGASPVFVLLGTTYADAGATALDNLDGDISGNIVTINPVNTNVVGSYTVTYNVSDAAGNAADEVTRTVNVFADSVKPVITLLGSNPVSLELGSNYTDAGATALDNIDGNITGAIVATSTVNTNAVGSYTVTYNVSDAAGNAATPITRTVNVVDTISPSVSIVNQPALVNTLSPFSVTFQFTENVNGFIDTDISVINGSVSNFFAVDGDTYAANIKPNGNGDVSIGVAAGVAQDDSLNNNTAAATVTVLFDNTPPVVVIDASSAVNQSNQYAYPVTGGCTAGDGNVTVSITVPPMIPLSNTVSCSGLGTWNTNFDVSAAPDGIDIINISASQSDAAGNTVNTVTVQDKDVLISVPTVNPLVTNSTTPVISGVADANTTVTVVIAGATYTTTATAGGSWSVDTSSVPDSGSLNLVSGSNEVTVTSVDAAGNSASDTSNNEVTLTLDDDNDGIPNAVECPSGPPYDNSCTDTDGDGTPDFMEVDSDNDGIPDAVEAGLNGNNPIDSDGDGIPDYQDTDSDNDNIPDASEGAGDTDGDGIPDYVDVGSSGDSDGDGIPDSVECPAYPACSDTNADGQPDYMDTDSDGDGINDAVEAGVDPVSPKDTDGDGIPDYRDTDSDGDGIDDITEGLVDVDSDGIPDYIDAVTAGPGAGDSDGDGIADNIECELYPLCADSDGDGTPDYMETDSDDDGIADAIEAGTASNDADADGIDDALDVDLTGGLDLNGDGIDDTLPLDTDGDGTPDYQDTDSDGDGITDAVEGVVDSDSDGVPDYLDASNGDASGDGIIGSGDSDGDGVSDAAECPTGIPCADIDQDGIPDYMDADATDGPIADFDNDGLTNYLDPDDDNDNIPDAVEDPNFDLDNDPATNPLDSDLDGIPDYLDDDSDGDGVSDKDESGASGNDSDNDNIDDSYDVDVTGGVDANLDGIDDDITPRDSDADNLPDYLDLVFDGDRSTVDSDNDGISDAVECPVFPSDCPDTDIDGTPDYLETDSDSDGINDSDETGALVSGILIDTDGDGIPDYQDTDSDNDGIDDSVEGILADSDGDGIPDAVDADSSGSPYGGDSDGDGVEDQAECSSYPVCADSDNDGTPDYMDADNRPYDPNATIDTALNGVGSNGPWSMLFIAMAFVLRRIAVKRN